jgi:hypothetical protein
MAVHGISRHHLPCLVVFLISCSASEGALPGECGDAADNDADGLFDCLDPDCYNAPDCVDDGDDGGDDDGDDGGDDDGDDGDSSGDDGDSSGDDGDSSGDDGDSSGDDGGGDGGDSSGDDGGDSSGDDGGDSSGDDGGDSSGDSSGEDDGGSGGEDGGLDTGGGVPPGGYDGTYCGTWTVVVSSGSDSDTCTGDAEVYINGSFVDMLGYECAWAMGSLGYDPIDLTLTGELNSFNGELWGTSLSGIEKGTSWEGICDSVDISGEISGDIQDTSGAATGEATFEGTKLTSGFECP